MPHQHRKTKSFGIYDESWEPKVAKQIEEKVHEAIIHAAASSTSMIDEAVALEEPILTFDEKKGEDGDSIHKETNNNNVNNNTVLPSNDSFLIGGGVVFDESESERSLSALGTTSNHGPQQQQQPPRHYHTASSGQLHTALSSAAFSKHVPDRPFMVALVGIPGSGKAISALVLANLLEGRGIGTMVMPHLGYHYPIDYLKSHFGDPDDMIYRRGAPDTFDASAFVRDVQRIRGEWIPQQQHGHSTSAASLFKPPSSLFHNNETGPEMNIRIPGFDHAKGDPEPDIHNFDRNHHKVVICEGLYLMHDADGWEELDGMFDLKIFIDETDVDVVMERLKLRNQCIPGYTPEEISVRVDKVDRINADIVLKSKAKADIVARNVSKPIQKEEKPPSPDAMSLALSALDLTDVDKAVIASKDRHDWTMDIMSRPESNMDLHEFKPLSVRSRSNSMASVRSNRTGNEPPPPPASQFVGTWEKEQALIILDRIKALAQGNPEETPEGGGGRIKNGKPYMVAMAATPGSGKSVSSFMLASILEDHGYPTMVCPHDGYHFPLDYLRTFPDADDMVYRRGAPDTFDPFALLRDLDRIRNGDEEIIKLPAFDHAKADPEPDTHIFDRNHHKIVLCEGLYLLHDQDGWEEVKYMFDYTIFMNADIDVCIERVKIRNLCIPGYTPEEIEVRCEVVDRVNALTVLRSKYRADVIVESAAMKK